MARFAAWADHAHEPAAPLHEADTSFGIRRLLKMLRHDTPSASATAARLGIEGPAIRILNASFDHKAGRSALARVFGAALSEGGELSGAGAMYRVQGAITSKLTRAEPGDIVAITMTGTVCAGQILATGKVADEALA